MVVKQLLERVPVAPLGGRDPGGKFSGRAAATPEILPPFDGEEGNDVVPRGGGAEGICGLDERSPCPGSLST